MVEMEGRGRREKWVLREQRETKEIPDQREVLVFEDHLEFLVPRGQRVVVDPLVCVVFKEKKEHRDHQQNFV